MSEMDKFEKWWKATYGWDMKSWNTEIQKIAKITAMVAWHYRALEGEKTKEEIEEIRDFLTLWTSPNKKKATGKEG